PTSSPETATVAGGSTATTRAHQPTATTAATVPSSPTTAAGTASAPLVAAGSYTMARGVGSPGLADFNRGGRPDVSAVGSGGVGVLLGRADGTFGAALMTAAGKNPTILAVGDFTGDGRSDAVVGDNQAKMLSLLAGRGDGTFTAAVSYPFPSNE